MVLQQDAPFGVVVRVALRELLEDARERRREERQVGERRRAFFQLRVEVRPQRLELGDVHFLDIGEVRMLRAASVMRCAIRRRTPITLISVMPVRARSNGLASPAAPPLPTVQPPRVRLESFGVMRPLGPEPCTWRRSIPASRALRRVAGDA